MAEKRTLRLTGGTTLAVQQVEIKKRLKEEVNEYELEDGTIVRVANPVTVIYRIEGALDPEGNPGYLVKVGTAVTVVRGPEKEG